MRLEGINSALRDIYEFHLDPKEQIKYELICKYREKVSERLLKEEICLYKKGREQGKIWLRETMQSFVTFKNPFFDLIKKEPFFEGKYLPVPISIKETSDAK